MCYLDKAFSSHNRYFAQYFGIGREFYVQCFVCIECYVFFVIDVTYIAKQQLVISCLEWNYALADRVGVTCQAVFRTLNLDVDEG